MLNSFWKKITMCLALVIGTVTTFAQDATNEVSDLWSSLGINFGDFFEKVFEALKNPIGTILAVVFVMAIFYFCVRMARTAINKRQSL